MTAVAFVNHVWQCTIFAGVAWLMTLALRRHRAGVRHAVWLLASLKFLVPFSVLVSAGGHFGWRAAQTTAQASISQIVETVSLPLSVPSIALDNVVSAAGVPAGGSAIPLLLLLWLGGAAAMVIVWIARWRRVAAIVRAGVRAEHGPVLDSLRRVEARVARTRPLPLVVAGSPFEPGVFGLLRPVLLWPRDLETHLTPEQIDTIIAHEVAHVRRRDNLGAALHMVVQAVFWIHPLVWWIGARLVDERERACDEDVVRMGGDPRAYAESILKTCQWCVETPLACVAGVTGSNLKRRVEQIMSADARAALTAWTRSVLAVAAMGSLAVPIAVGALGAPPLRAQAPPSTQPGAPAAKPAFDVTSVKPNKSGDGRMGMLPASNGGWRATNVTLGMLIRLAFQVQDNQIVGGPKWLFEDRFDVLGSGDAPGSAPALLLPKMQTLLADRFSLVTHTETRELPMYALVRAREDRLGPNLKPSTAADCPAPPPPGAGNPQPMPQPMSPAQMQVCGVMLGPGRISSGHVTIDQIANNLSRIAGSMVVDKTGLQGFYDFTLEFVPDPSLAGRSDLPGRPPGLEQPANDGPSLFAALPEQLGLKLESTRGPVSVLVIDRAEQPVPD